MVDDAPPLNRKRERLMLDEESTLPPCFNEAKGIPPIPVPGSVRFPFESAIAGTRRDTLALLGELGG